MPMLQHDMTKVEKWGESLPEGWYHFRLTKIEGPVKSKSSGEDQLIFTFKCQEEPFVGRNQMDFVSLQPHALAKLKSYYSAAGYNPGPEGHDPDNILEAEYYLLLVEDTYEGQKRSKIPPWGIRAIEEGKLE